MKIGNSLVERVECIIFLGITIDENLTFKQHSEYICSKLSKSVGILYKLKYCFPTEAFKCIYNSFIVPYIHYGIEIWYSAYKNITDKKFILQKKAIRAAFNLPYNDHTSNYFKCAGALKLADLYSLKIACIMFKCINLNQFPFIYNKLKPSSEVHQYSTRASNLLRLPFYNKAKSQRSFLYNAIKIWNKFSGFSNQISVNSFKISVFSFYLDEY